MGNKPDKSNKGTLLAIVLIVIGVIWLFKRSIIYFNIPDFYWYNLHFPFRPSLHSFRYLIFSWPVILIIVGLILMAGRRKSGIVFIIIGCLFFIPKIIHIPLITATIIIPIVLIAIGIVLIAKFLSHKDLRNE